MLEVTNSNVYLTCGFEYMWLGFDFPCTVLMDEVLKLIIFNFALPCPSKLKCDPWTDRREV